MKKLIILMVSIYAVSLVMFFGVIFSFNSINDKLINGFSQTSKVASDSELTNRFLSKVKSGQFSTDDYVELFSLNFEAEKAGVASIHAVVTLNNDLRDLLSLVIILQLLLLTLFVKYSKKA